MGIWGQHKQLAHCNDLSVALCSALDSFFSQVDASVIIRELQDHKILGHTGVSGP